MKIILSEGFMVFRNIKVFNRKNIKDVLASIKSLPKQKYEMELFETNDNKGFVLSFDNDLHIKVMNDDRNEFEKSFGIKVGDHINVDLGELFK